MPARPSRAEVATREAQALELRRNGATYAQIGDRIGISESAAAKMVKRVLARYVVEAVPDVRKLELDRLDLLQRTALLVMGRTHYVTSGGKVVYTTPADGQRAVPLVDDGPVLAAIDRLVRIGESRRRLLGVDPPIRHDVTVRTDAEIEAELADVKRQLDELPVPTADQLHEAP